MSRNQRIALAISAAVVLLAGVVAVFVVTGGEDDDTVETTATETSVDDSGDGAAEPDTGDADDADGSADAPGDEGVAAPTTRPSAGGGGDEPVSSGDTAKTDSAGGGDTMATATPPKAGAYKYRVVRDGQNEESTTTVEDRGREGDAVRQRIVLESEEGTLDNEVSWRSDGLYILETTVIGGKCDWQPDSLQLRLPLAAGVTWTSESSCTAETDFGTFDIKRKLTAKVNGKQRVTVAGEAVDVWVIEEQEHIEFSGQGQGPEGAPQPISGTDDSTGTTLFSPKHGLSVKYERHSKTTMGADTRERNVSAEILNLAPQ